MAYSSERKAAVLKKMLPPNNVPLRQLSQDEGISEATLHSWRKEARSKGQLLPDADAGPEGSSSLDKFAAVVETAAMNAAPGRVLPPAWPLRRADHDVDKHRERLHAESTELAGGVRGFNPAPARGRRGIR